MTGDEEADRGQIAEAAGGPIDCVLDLLPRMAAASQVLTAVLAVRPGGRVVLMGGVRKDLPLPYNWLMHSEVTLRGQWMYPRDAATRMVQLVRGGLVDLMQFDVSEFGLDEANEAVAHAADHAGPFQLTVLRPDRDRRPGA
jgi:alcohol dehydrogenase